MTNYDEREAGATAPVSRPNTPDQRVKERIGKQLYKVHKPGCKVRRPKSGCKCPVEARVYDSLTKRTLYETRVNKSAAESWQQDTAAGLKAGTIKPPSDMTVGDALQDHLDRAATGGYLVKGAKPKPSTMRKWEKDIRLHLTPRIGHHKLTSFGPTQLHALIDDLKSMIPAKAPSTIDGILDPLRIVLKRAARFGVIAVDPFTTLDRKQVLPAKRAPRDRIATLAEAGERLALLDDLDRAVWGVGFYAGLRIGEARSLRWEDVNLEAGLMRVAWTWDYSEGPVATKTGAGTRDVPISAELRKLLIAHRLRTGRSMGLVFGTEDGVAHTYVGFGTITQRPFAYSRLRERSMRCWGWKSARPVLSDGTRGEKREWVQARKDALEPFNFHATRHTFASLLIAGGVDIKTVSRLMGHASVVTTMDIYTHLLPDAMQTAASVLDEAFERLSLSEVR